VVALRWILGLVFLSAQAHAFDLTRPLAQLQMTTWDRSRGLPSSFITALAQTPDGYLWIGTNLGLVRFDGVRFTTFRKASEPGLPSDYIQKLAVGRGGLWIGTATGLARYRDGTIKAFGAEHGLPSEEVRTLLEDRSGGVWVSTNHMLYRLDGDRFVAPMDEDGTPVRRVSDVLEARDGTIWIAADAIRRWRDGRLEPPRGMPMVTFLAEDAEGTMWGIGLSKLTRIRGEELQTFDLPRDIHTGGILDASGAMWMTSGASGLIRRQADGTIETLTPENGLPAIATTSLLFDREGNLWVGTDAGLVRLGEPRITTFSRAQGLPDRMATALAEDAEGRIWVGTQRGAARIERGRVERVVPELEKTAISAIHVDKKDRVWIGAFDGVYRRDEGRLDKLGTRVAFAVVDDAEGGVWLATNAGAIRVTDAGEEKYGQEQGLPGDIVATVRPARDGSVWLGTTAGACRISGGAPQCFGPDEGAPRSKVLAIHEDGDGTIWLGTHEGGLYRFRDGRFARFGTEQGLPSNSHFAVVEDDRGRLWTSSDIGITRIDKASLDRVVAGATPRAEVRLYDERDGMRSGDCVGVGITGLRARDGRLWFATTDGVVVIDPAAGDPVPPMLPAVLEPASFSGRTVPSSGSLELPAGNDRFALHFAAPTMTWGRDVTFRYRLAGFDRDWIETDDATASYTNVPPGRYAFAVQARARPGDWGPAAEMAVALPPRFWQTGAFRVGVVVAALLLVLAVARWRLALLVRQQRRLEGLVGERTRDLAEAKRELEQANATLEERVDAAVRSLREAERMAAYGQMVAGVAHEVRQPIFALGMAAHVIGQTFAGREDVARQVALVQRETRRVNAIMDELLDFARPAELVKASLRPKTVLAEAADIFNAEHGAAVAVTVDVDPELPPVPLDEARMVQVLVNLMGNARKHAAGLTRIVLRGAVAGGRLRLEVENDGAGIPAGDLPQIFEPFFSRGKGKGTGLGLAIVRRIVTEHGGEIRVASGDAGTCFTIELPLAGESARSPKA
jgi:signal transduction histidine kinase/ligand-binding sensor domain-containing protein